MGVPRFFSHISDRYPSILSSAKESIKKGLRTPLHTPNPNGHEFHNLYIDLNGIIHQSLVPFPGKNQKGKLTNEEVFSNVTVAIERLIDIVRPRVLLYIAIDGPAPIAKQQQQRKRRFFSAKQDSDRLNMYTDLKKEIDEKNLNIAVPPLEEKFDSNLVSPGSEFMYELSIYLNKYIERMLQSQEWKFRVLFSDAQVPGEGEHKILRFIKSQIEHAGSSLYPSTRHIIYGLDADLIFLALSLHEPHTTIIREHMSGREQKCHFLDPNLRFKFVHLYTLREYLAREFAMPNVAFTANFERIVNDFILFSIFLGNDFLPPLPTLDITQGALDVLFSAYRAQLQEMQDEGYLVYSDQANFNPKSLAKFLARVANLSKSKFLNHKSNMHKAKLEMKDGTIKKAMESYIPSIKIHGKHFKTNLNIPDKSDSSKSPDSMPAQLDSPVQPLKNNVESQDSSSVSSPTSTSSDLQETVYPKEQEIYVGNIPKSVTVDQLEEIFGSCGKILRITMPKNQFTNLSKGFAFITYDSESSATSAIRIYTKGIKIDGMQLNVSPAMKNDASQSNDNTDLYKTFISELGHRLKREENIIRNFELPFGTLDHSLDDDVMYEDWKKRYYQHYCDIIDESTEGFKSEIKKMAHSYIQGLHFVLQYYLLDLPSWDYFYQYHRAPFCEEVLLYVDEYSNELRDSSKPFRPVDQLLAILPFASNSGLPKVYQILQKTIFRRFFPEDFYIDFDCKMHWEAHPILPFINRKDFYDVLSKVDASTFTENERKRNEFHDLKLYVPFSATHIPFSLACCRSLTDISRNGVFQEYTLDIRPPSKVIISLLYGIQTTQWNVEKKVKFGFKNVKAMTIKELQNQIEQLQSKVEILTSELKMYQDKDEATN